MATKQINEFTAVGASALTDQLLTETAANATRKCTLSQVFALLDDQAMTWTAAQAFGAAVTMATTLGVTGAATFASTVGVTGTLTAGNLATGGTLAVTGTSSHTGAATFGSTLGVTGATTLSSTLAAGASTLASLAVTGAATIGTTLGVTGAATLSSTLGVTGLSTLTGGVAAVAAATVVTTNAVGGRKEHTTTMAALTGEGVAAPTGSSGANWYGMYGRAEVKSGNAQNLTHATGLIGLSGAALHAGSGAVTGAASLHAAAITNTGGGTLTNAYGAYLVSQTAGTNNWGFYAAGNASKFINSTLAPIQVSNTTSFRGALGSNSNVGTYLAYLAEYDGTNWYARSTGAGVVRTTNSNFTVYLDSSGLTADTTYTPTQRFNVDSTHGGKCLIGPTAPTVISSGAYALSTSPTFAGTSGTVVGIGSQPIVQPSGATTANYYSGLFYVDTVAADTTAITGLIGARIAIRNLGDGNVTTSSGLDVNGSTNAGAGVITNYYGIRSRAITNTGAGSITTAIGLQIDAQTAGATNWGLYQVGSTTNNRFSGKLGIAMDPTNTLDVTGTFGVTGVSTFGAQINLKSYTVATLPSAATGGGMVWVSDAAGSACGALSNGTNWKRCDDMAVTVS